MGIHALFLSGMAVTGIKNILKSRICLPDWVHWGFVVPTSVFVQQIKEGFECWELRGSLFLSM